MDYINAMIAVFGWLDVLPPNATLYAWYAAVGVIALLAFRYSRWRHVLALIGIGVAIVGIPIVAQGRQAAHLGYIWQGRYLLAVAVGLPLLATFIVANRMGERYRALSVSAQVLLLGTIAVGGFMAFYDALHRYSVGVNVPLVTRVHAWTPPGGFFQVVGVYVFGVLVLSGLVLASNRTSKGATANGPKAHRWVARRNRPSPVLASGPDVHMP
jgi:hypothetical protein